MLYMLRGHLIGENKTRSGTAIERMVDHARQSRTTFALNLRFSAHGISNRLPARIETVAFSCLNSKQHLWRSVRAGAEYL